MLCGTCLTLGVQSLGQLHIKVKWRSDAATTNTLCGGIEHGSPEIQRPGHEVKVRSPVCNILQSVRWTDLVGDLCDQLEHRQSSMFNVRWTNDASLTRYIITSSSKGDCYNRSLSAANGSVWRDEGKTYSYDPSGKAVRANTLPALERPTDGV